MTPGEIAVGSIADCVAAVAALAGTILSIFALKLARDANATAEQSRRDAIEAREREQTREQQAESREREREERARLAESKLNEREAMRDRRSLATTLQAWWVAKPTGGTWGVLVSNEGPSSTVFHDVEIDATGNKYAEGPIRIKTVPPGTYFVESTKGPWPLPRNVTPADDFVAITKSNTHDVTKTSFTDPLGTRWAWTPRNGLAQVTTPSTQEPEPS